MQIYTVSFFGHRRITDWQTAETRLLRQISDLIKTKEYVEFLVGRNGDFDQMAASAVRSTKRELDYGNSELVYVAEKQPKNIAELESYYDRAEVCSEAANAHFKAAIQTRNKAMVERSDMVICCIEHNSGGRGVVALCFTFKRTHVRFSVRLKLPQKKNSVIYCIMDN